MSWTSSDLALSERLYFSNNYTALRDAGIGDSEDQGVQLAGYFDQVDLVPDTYYWRVDTTELSGVVRGSIWVFTVVDPALILGVSFDGEVGANDASGRGNHGTAVNAPSQVEGQCGDGCSFNESAVTDQIFQFGVANGSDDFDFGVSTDFTVSAWVKRSGLPRNEVIISNKNWDSGLNSGWIIGIGNNQRLEWNLGDGTNRSDYDGPANQLPADQWMHLAVAFDRDALANTYLNGRLVDSRSISHVGDIDTEFTTNLAADGHGDYALRGALDEIQVWARVLGPAELARVYRRSTKYHKWAEQHYSAFELDVDSISAPLADSDHDGMPNLVDFAFQSSPLIARDEELPAMLHRDGALAFSYTRMKGGEGLATYSSSGVDYDVLVSTDLTADNWQSNASFLEVVDEPIDGPHDTEQVFIRGAGDYADAEQLFFRLQLRWR